MHINRYFGTAIMPFGRNSKPPTFRNEKHLKWIRRLPCVVSGLSGDTIDAHHVHLKSQGVNDYLTVPLDHELHMELHAHPVEDFQDHHLVDLKDALIAKLVERIIFLESAVGEMGNARK